MPDSVEERGEIDARSAGYESGIIGIALCATAPLRIAAKVKIIWST